MLTYYNRNLISGINSQPDKAYKDLQQAVISDQWDNTSVIETVQEQVSIGSDKYREVEVWINYVVGQSSTGLKTGEDFLQFGFEDINHPRTRGLYYKFDDNIWMIYDYNYHNGLAKNVAVRKCNNALRWINPTNGAVETVPCVIDYDMSSPSVQISQSILTPNNHAVVQIQGNSLTINQLKTNMRFILGGRPFKLYGIQNALLQSQSNQEPTYMMYDLYLDEIQANDDIENSIAFNGHYDYDIIPNQLSVRGVTGDVGELFANVLLNGQEVDRQLVWESSKRSVIEVDEEGNYTILGVAGDTASINVHIVGNPSNTQTIPIMVVDVADETLDIHMEPPIERIREYESIEFEVKVSKGGKPYNDYTSVMSLDNSVVITTNKFLSIEDLGGHRYNLSCTCFDSTLKPLYITVTDNATNNSYQESFDIRTVNMFG